ncbi:putative transporter, major facilitator family protein [Trichinella nativa]|uniref:Putative transporter, major facilitator family protein n=1 Tax=Trichinella nativa TaxID=6335 RepID=A0A1Y3EQL3_9BILA|nr:putative transporter, major facilitator family protein [Trichinella nativa]
MTTTPSTAVDFDHILQSVGSFGLYQRFILILLSIPSSLISSWVAFAQIFAAASPQHTCFVPRDFVTINMTDEEWKNSTIPFEDDDSTYFHKTVKFSKCKQFDTEIIDHKIIINKSSIVDCKYGWNYNHDIYDTTIVTDLCIILQMNLVCYRDFWPAFSLMAFNIGGLFGNFFIGHIADRYGRKIALFLMLAVISIFGTASAFATDIYTYVALRFFVGSTFPALFSLPFVIGIELSGPQYRIMLNTAFCTFFGLSFCLLCFIASLLRNWKHLLIVTSAPSAVYLIFWWIIPESPRWLLLKKRYSQASDILVRAARFNRRSRQVGAVEQEDQASFGSEPTVLDLFRTPNLRKITILVTYICSDKITDHFYYCRKDISVYMYVLKLLYPFSERMFRLVNSTVYNGLIYDVPNMQLNDYANLALSAAVEVPASLITWPMVNNFGRRCSLTSTMLFGGAITLSAIFFANMHPWVEGGLAAVGKFAISASFTIIYAYASELYPTESRAIGIGWSSVVALLGVITAPYIIYLTSDVRALPLMIMGVLTISGGILALLLPETRNIRLPETIEEAEVLYQTSTATKRFCSLTRRGHRHSNRTNDAQSDSDNTVVERFLIR